MTENIFERLPEIVKQDGVMRDYVRAHDLEFDSLDDKVDQVVTDHQVDNATGDELDRIGAIYGPLGRRAGRSDQEYRIYLKSVIPSFNGRGSVAGVRFASAAGLGIDESNIEIREDFENVEYDVLVLNWPPHRGSTVEELPELADPSGVNLSTTLYGFSDEATVADKVDTTEGQQYTEDVTVDDTVDTTETTIEWDTGSWDSMEWAVSQ